MRELAPDDETMREKIARRAYELSQSDGARSDEENWLQAERELQEGAQTELP